MTEPEARQAFLEWVERDGQATIARTCDVHKAHLSQMVHSKRPVTPAVWAAMGLRRVVTFEPAA